MVLQLAAPAHEQLVDGRRADDRRVRHLQAARVEQERAGLRAAEPAVEGDELLERAALVEGGVVEAAHHDVGHVREAVRAQQVARRGGGERRQRILALDVVVLEPALAGGPEHQGAVLGRVHEQPPDVRMASKRRDQLGMALVDLLAREPPGRLHQVDEPEVARAEHDDVAVADVVLRPLARLGAPGGLVDGHAHRRRALVTGRHPFHFTG